MKNIIFPLIASVVLFGSSFDGSTTSAVTLVGGIIKAKHVESVKKYKRKDCPVCKGKGKYLSGDNIKWVDCGYCEPEKETSQPTLVPPSKSGVINNGSTTMSCGPNGCRVIKK
jgi:hypothetical protein